MEGDARQARRLLHAGRRAQATLEFAFSAPLLLLCFFGAIDAAAWSMQSSAAVASVEQGARLAASAAGSPLGQKAPNAAQVTNAVAAQLKTAMFATAVRPWCDPHALGACAARPCPQSPDAVEAVFGSRVLAVCVQEQDPARCTVPPSATAAGVPAYCNDSPTVTVRIIGFAASLVPPSFGLGWHAGEIPFNIGATAHVLRFAP